MTTAGFFKPMCDYNAEALRRRATLPDRNRFSLEQLLKLPPYFGWVDCRVDGVKFRMLLGGADDGVALRFFWNGSYEPMSLRAWCRVAAHTQLALDIGAHTGVYTLAALTTNPSIAVASFEPHFMNFARLNLNIRSNGASTANAFMVAVGAENDVLPFSTSAPLDWLTSGGAIGERSNTLTTPVQVVSLDRFLSAAIVPKLGLVKIDTEGYEIESLSGMMDAVTSARPTIFFECLDAKTGSGVEDLLRPLGYSFLEVDDNAGTIVAVDSIVPSLDRAGKPIYGRLNRIATASSSASSALAAL